MNTSAVSLSTYDIVVALVENETGESLHSHVEKLKEAVPRASAYVDLAKLVLDVVALKQGRAPSQAGYEGIDYSEMLKEWNALVSSVDILVQLLEEEKIYDQQRLPSYTPIPVIAALCKFLPDHPDKQGNSWHLLKKYLWRSFLTDRYEHSATSYALQDYRELKKIISNGGSHESVPIFNASMYPMPSKEQIILAGWPKRASIFGRALLALQIKCGAVDIADGKAATEKTIGNREYHHLFPASTLEDAGIPAEEIFRAVNCALITWRTNRVLSNKDPLEYLNERTANSTRGEDGLKSALRTHLIPYSPLAVGYTGLSDEERRKRVKTDYNIFASARGDILIKAIEKAFDGTFKPDEFIGSV